MAIHEAIFLTFFLISTLPQSSSTRTIDDDQHCSPQSCSSDNLPIRFPFGLKQQLNSSKYLCGYPKFDLSCNMSQTIIDFPFSGQFTVTNLSYAKQWFEINDPDNCLPRRLLYNKLNLTGTPFFAVADELVNYTYFNCSAKSEFNVKLSSYKKLSCLSGVDYFVLGGPTKLAAEVAAEPPCRVVGEVLGPARKEEVVDLNEDIRLGWDDFGCGLCEKKGEICGFMGLEVGCYNLPKSHSGFPRSAKYGLLIGVGIPGLLGLIGIGCYISGKIWAYTHPQSPNTNIGLSSTSQHTIIILGLCEKTINSYPKTILGESKRLPKNKPSDDATCSICLCEYQPKETLRTIPECNHFFHAHCVDEWLRLNATCPLCRNTPDGPSQTDTPVSSLSLLLSSPSSSYDR